jgi:hypothetical protein
MATTGVDPRDWQSLLHQTNDLVTQVHFELMIDFKIDRSQPDRIRRITSNSPKWIETFNNFKSMLALSGREPTSSGR